MMRLRVQWTGPGVVGPSVTTFYGVGAPSPWRTALIAFLTNQAARLPDDVQLSIPNAGDELNAQTGAIEGSWTAGTATTVNGASTAAFAIGTGLRYVWETNGITRGRHVRGSTYLVPAVSTMFDTTGRLLPAVQSSMLLAGQTFLTDSQGVAVVWTRPKGFLPGAFHPIIGVSVPENPTSLRSRRV